MENYINGKESMYSMKDVIKKEIIIKDNISIIGYLKIPYILILNPSKDAIFTFRLAQKTYSKGLGRIAKILHARLVRKYGLHISLKSQIGLGLSLRHVNGVVIGDGVILGSEAIIYQQVTLGGKKLGDSDAGNYPVVGNNVTFFAGCKVLGAIKIGDNATIAANAVVISDVEENSVYAGVPARRIK